jgi:ubiquinone/menaquinone biosynthesis C-methylase UbiE
MFTVGLNNLSNREQWLETTLKSLPAGLTILDAGAGECPYKKWCSHLNYISQDFGQYEGTGEDGLQTGSWDNTKLDIVSDIIAIPLGDASVDVIMCTEVFEHIPNFKKSFSECYRVLNKDGEFLFTIPFNPNYEESKIRASIDSVGRLVHFQEPEFHGNPMSEKGSLVFTDFGWDVLKSLRDVGFKDSRVEIYQNPFLGHITLQLIFRCKK